MSRQSRRKHGGSRDERREAIAHKRSLAWREAQQRLCGHGRIEYLSGEGTSCLDCGKWWPQ